MKKVLLLTVCSGLLFCQSVGCMEPIQNYTNVGAGLTRQVEPISLQEVQKAYANVAWFWGKTAPDLQKFENLYQSGDLCQRAYMTEFSKKSESEIQKMNERGVLSSVIGWTYNTLAGSDPFMLCTTYMQGYYLSAKECLEGIPHPTSEEARETFIQYSRVEKSYKNDSYFKNLSKYVNNIQFDIKARINILYPPVEENKANHSVDNGGVQETVSQQRNLQNEMIVYEQNQLEEEEATGNNSPQSGQKRPSYSEGETQTAPTEESNYSEFTMIPIDQFNSFTNGLQGNAPLEFCANLQENTAFCVPLRDMASIMRGIIQTTVQETIAAISKNPQARLMLTNRQSEEILEDQNVTNRSFSDVVKLINGDKVYSQGERTWFGGKCSFEFLYNGQKCNVTANFYDDGFLDLSEGIIVIKDGSEAQTYIYPVNDKSVILFKKSTNFVDLTKIQAWSVQNDDFRCWSDKEMIHFGPQIFEQGQSNETHEKLNGNGFMIKKGSGWSVKEGTYRDGEMLMGTFVPNISLTRYFNGTWKAGNDRMQSGIKVEANGQVKSLENGFEKVFTGQYTDPFNKKFNVKDGKATEITGNAVPVIEEVE